MTILFLLQVFVDPTLMLLLTSLPSCVPRDPHSVAKPHLVRTSHLHLDLEADFERKIFSGKVVLTLEKMSSNVSSLALDVSDLTISTMRSEGRDLAWTLEKVGDLGDKLEIELAETADRFEVEISYSTSPSSSALQWLTADQTSGGKKPYVYSQCQAWVYCVYCLISFIGKVEDFLSEYTRDTHGARLSMRELWFPARTRPR